MLKPKPNTGHISSSIHLSLQSTSFNINCSPFFQAVSFKEMSHQNFLFSGNRVNSKKQKDIQKLLEKYYGEEWETDSSLQFYTTVISASKPGNCSNQEEENLCCPLIDYEELVV
jgi:hypothetical protein